MRYQCSWIRHQPRFCPTVGTITHSPAVIDPLKRTLFHLRRIAVDIIFLVCTIGGLAAVSLISLTLLLIAVDKIEV